MQLPTTPDWLKAAGHQVAALPGRLLRRPLPLGAAHRDLDAGRRRGQQHHLHRAGHRLRQLHRRARANRHHRGHHRELRHEPGGHRRRRAPGSGRLGRVRQRRSRQHDGDRRRQQRPRLADGRLLGGPARVGAAGDRRRLQLPAHQTPDARGCEVVGGRKRAVRERLLLWRLRLGGGHALRLPGQHGHHLHRAARTTSRCRRRRTAWR